MADAFIALGSNMGDRAEYLRSACSRLAELPRTRIAARSWVYATEPVGPKDQGEFLNAALKLETTLEPVALLHHLQAIERGAGRRRDEAWGPRTLDLDLLLYDDQIISTNALILPHPRLHERRFVLQPLCDIDPELIHPSIGEPMKNLLVDCPPMKIDAVEIDHWS